MLRLTTAHARRVADAAHALATADEFDGPDAWRAAAMSAVRAAFGAAASTMTLPPCRARDAADAEDIAAFAAEDVAPALIARCDAMFRLGPDRSDDPAAREPGRILAACAAADVRVWHGPSFVAHAADRMTDDRRPVRQFAFIREVIEPAGMWHGPHLRARVGEHDAVLSTSPPSVRHAWVTEESALLLADVLQPAFAAGVRAACARWGRPAPKAARATPPATARPTSAPRLTEREREVAALLAQRRTNREIAGALRLSEHTARHHTERVMRKLGYTSRRDVRMP